MNWIPKLLNPEQKLCRQHICEENLGALTDDEELFSKIVGVSLGSTDKQESMQWIHNVSPPPKKQERRPGS
jgi:hypothetical protein